MNTVGNLQSTLIQSMQVYASLMFQVKTSSGMISLAETGLFINQASLSNAQNLLLKRNLP
jgi:hypothetical protein